jgi:hypothetical protein
MIIPGMKSIRPTKEFWISLTAVLIIATLLTFGDKSGLRLRGWVVYTILLGLAGVCIYAVGKSIEATRGITRVALIAFFLRLGIGAALTLLLPVYGYQDNSEHYAGYFYTDSYIRDNQAWELASSGQPLTTAFSGRYSGDQYGGMLAISAFIYRFLSPDVHRPFLILILNAAASAIGVLCLWKASGRWFGEKTALLAAWIFALYPESVLLGSTQMREAIVIPLIAVAYFGLTEIQSGKNSGWAWIVLSGLIMVPIQPLVSFISFAVLLGMWLFDPDTLRALQLRRKIFIIAISLSILLVALLVASSVLVNLPSLQNAGPLSIYLSWFKNNFAFQSYMLERSSGMFQSLINGIGERWRWLIILVYGIAQPVLPAIVGDPTAQPMLRVIGFLRAAGWYALVLFLIYGTLGVLRSRQETRRYQLIWISLVNWAWIMVSALNAGADQWDNPRYRVVLLVWQVVLAAWAWEWARSRNDAWLWRWLVVELVFVGLFTEWYVGRYYPGIIHLDIKWMSLLTLLVCGLILLGGVIWDRMHKVKPSSRDSGL